MKHLELRRRLLKGGSTLLLTPFIGSGLLIPGRVLASEWNRTAFTANNSAEALKQAGITNVADSRDIEIRAPEIAENGGKVEVEIFSKLADSRKLLILAERNPMPLCATLDFHGKALAYARVQLKLAESMRIRAIVRTADGRNHVAFREIKVTLGGCGG